MTLILDTSILIDLEKGNQETTHKIETLSRIHPSQPCISFMTYTEFLIGMETVGEKKKAKLYEFLMNFTVMHTTRETALILSRLKHDYDKKGKKKSLTDIFIASQAIEHNMKLVTKDKDFEEIVELDSYIL